MSVAARLLLASVVGGGLVAALALPAVGAVGVGVRNAARKFNTMATPELGRLPVRSEILDRKGGLLAYYDPRGIDRVPVSFSQIAPVMREAIVAIEDSRYYQHGAIDFKGTMRALINDLQHKPIQGGSTLAQQYVKNVLILSSPNPRKEFASAAVDTVGRKIRELRMAVRVEHTMTKNQVLAGYLNAAYYGNNAYGVEVAAKRYFSVPAAKLTLPQGALLAGLVENPARYNPLAHPKTAVERRNTVLARMAQVGDITAAQAAAAEKAPLGLRPSGAQSGCTSKSAQYAAYFCDYVLAVMRHDPALKKAYKRLNGIGGLKIYTTLDPADQNAAQHAVDYEVPPPPSSVNPGKNADTEVLIQPGTGKVRAIAIDRPYGTGKNQNSVDYAVGPQYDGGEGFQIGSSGKVYTLVTALKEGIPFGYAKKVHGTAVVSGFRNCQGAPAGVDAKTHVPGQWSLTNDQSELNTATYTLYTATEESINTFFAPLEKKVGLCNTVKTAASMGLTWPDGTSLLKKNPATGKPSADNDPSFTLGADNVTPMSVAAADATLPARGIYCHPVAITKITTVQGKKLPVESAHCHRVLPQSIADAANYVLQSDLTGGTATQDQIGRPAASKTGTADQYKSAFFVGYTPGLLGTVWVGNPNALTSMTGSAACYRGGCVGAMYGSQAPGNTWQQTFLHAKLASPPLNFVSVPPSSPLFDKGSGKHAPKPTTSPSPPPSPGHHHGGPGPLPSPGPTGPAIGPTPPARGGGP